MQILVIVAHPDESSLNHAITKQVQKTLTTNGHTVILHDLYKENFDPSLSTDEIPRNSDLPDIISRHCDETANADGIVIVHPNWWGMPPALLKGWIDRVLRPGVAYDFVEGDNGEGIPVGLLKADKALIFNTSNTTEEREIAVFGDPLERIWKDCIFKLCGVKNIYRRMFQVVVTSTQDEREQWLEDVQGKVNEYFPAKS